MGWYFNDDWGIDWLRENIDVRLDPPLLDVLWVRKNRVLEFDGRRVLPFNWESAFTACCELEDPQGGCANVTVNLKNFIQNPVWARHQLVQYIKAWLPFHLEFRGKLWSEGRSATIVTTILDDVAPPSPPSPWGIEPWAESTVRINDVSEADREGIEEITKLARTS